jgi:hypothetical protein
MEECKSWGTEPLPGLSEWGCTEREAYSPTPCRREALSLDEAAQSMAQDLHLPDEAWPASRRVSVGIKMPSRGGPSNRLRLLSLAVVAVSCVALVVLAGGASVREDPRTVGGSAPTRASATAGGLASTVTMPQGDVARASGEGVMKVACDDGCRPALRDSEWICKCQLRKKGQEEKKQEKQRVRPITVLRRCRCIPYVCSRRSLDVHL